MTTLDMKCILMLAETLNFTKTAMEMNITQPAFSRMIIRAENELGFKLFTRNTRAVELTREGEVFISSLRKSYAIYQSGVDVSRRMLREGNTLNVACAAEFISLELAPHILDFRKEHPNTFVECIPTATEHIPNLLRNKQADICFFFADRKKFNSDFESEVMHRIPLHLVISKENPLSQKEILKPIDLENEKIVTLQSNISVHEIGSYGSPLFLLNRASGLHLKESVVALTTQECMLHVACNQGGFFLASTLEYLVPPNCVMKEIEGIEFSFVALWNKGGLTALAQKFLDHVRQVNYPDLCSRKHK